MRILMVCLGNICRSPMAEGILRSEITKRKLTHVVDSAGTGNWHSGEAPDRRAIATAKKFGVDISKLVARQIDRGDLESFDKIFVMDLANYDAVLRLTRNAEEKAKVELFLNQVNPGQDEEVPDPWFGEADGFIPVYKMLETACTNFLNTIEKIHQS
ncbi:MAG: low molecular weight phosphotyrosine protein phosphatase [Bacteroidetes bacterium]|nr:low molecular weight phosphotyrosine protein phosphatase [Bacteroidota bacterium]